MSIWARAGRYQRVNKLESTELLCAQSDPSKIATRVIRDIICTLLLSFGLRTIDPLLTNFQTFESKIIDKAFLINVFHKNSVNANA